MPKSKMNGDGLDEEVIFEDIEGDDDDHFGDSDNSSTNKNSMAERVTASPSPSAELSRILKAMELDDFDSIDLGSPGSDNDDDDVDSDIDKEEKDEEHDDHNDKIHGVCFKNEQNPLKSSVTKKGTFHYDPRKSINLDLNDISSSNNCGSDDNGKDDDDQQQLQKLSVSAVSSFDSSSVISLEEMLSANIINENLLREIQDGQDHLPTPFVDEYDNDKENKKVGRSSIFGSTPIKRATDTLSDSFRSNTANPTIMKATTFSEALEENNDPIPQSFVDEYKLKLGLSPNRPWLGGDVTSPIGSPSTIRSRGSISSHKTTSQTEKARRFRRSFFRRPDPPQQYLPVSVHDDASSSLPTVEAMRSSSTPRSSSFVKKTTNRLCYHNHRHPLDPEEHITAMPSFEEERTVFSNATIDSSRSDPRRRKFYRPWQCILAVLVGIIGIGVVFACMLVLLKSKFFSQSGEYTPKQQNERLAKVQGLIVDTGISSYDNVYLPSPSESMTPQYKAAIWIATHDPFTHGVKISSLENKYYNVFLDRYVLAVLFYALGGGDTTLDDFLSPYDACLWDQYYSNSTNRTFGSIDDTDFRMTIQGCQDFDNNGMLRPAGMSLAFHHGLTGKLPDEISHLDKLLVSLVVNYYPSLGGTIPTAISTLTNLRYLSLEHCSLAGPIPDWIGTSLTELTHIALGNNRLTGTVPISMSILSESLTYLSLDNNYLRGNIQKSLGKLTNLQYLYLADNRFDGQLTPSLLMKNWSSLIEFDASENLIDSNLPKQLFLHPYLEMFNLNGNRLTGSMPSVTNDKNNTRLRFLELNENELSGRITTSLSTLRSLQHLDLSQNMLSSSIPEELGTMVNLQSIFLGENDILQDEFPSFLTSLPGLKELSLRKLGLIGTIPDSIAYLTALEYLDLSRNELTGPLPDTIGFLSNLSMLLLRDNHLSGSLPDSLNRLTNLDTLLLELNNLAGTASSLCDSKSPINGTSTIALFGADCGGSSPLIECSCCQICCEAGQDSRSCHDNHYGSANLP